MHDVLEGCAPYEVKELLKYLRLVSIQYVNDQMRYFAYAPSDVRSKPTPIPESTFKSLLNRKV